MSQKTLAMLLSINMCFSFKVLSQSSWEIEKNKDGIEVYTKIEEGSDFKSFKAVMVVQASFSEVISVLIDADNYTTWYGFTKTSKVLKQQKDIQYNYVETIFPWPYSNRDMVYKMSISYLNSEEINISLKGIPDYIPTKKGIVRMQAAEGHIGLKRQDGATKVIYIFHSEPGNKVPAWLANSSIAELPFKTLLGLRNVLTEEHRSR